jgi:hypothetical protein
MIVNRDISPERDLYYLGGRVIEILISTDGKEVDYFDLYEKTNKELNISVNLYTLVLVWLFMIGCIKNADNGVIVKCF